MNENPLSDYSQLIVLYLQYLLVDILHFDNNMTNMHSEFCS